MLKINPTEKPPNRGFVIMLACAKEQLIKGFLEIGLIKTH
jgi:hypothetical protein